MKNSYKKLSLIIASLVLFTGVAHAASILQYYGGGTGTSSQIIGMVKSNGTVFSTATDGTDYLSSTTGYKVDQTVPQTITGTVLATGTFGSGWTEPNLGAGTRMLFYPRKGAFRAGTVNSTQWDNANIGIYSTAFGNSNIASDTSSFAAGQFNTASGFSSIVFGQQNISSGNSAFASGANNLSSGDFSFASGQSAMAYGAYSFTAGGYYLAANNASFAAGNASFAVGGNSFAFGNNTIAGKRYYGNNYDSASKTFEILGDVRTEFANGNILRGYDSESLGDYFTATVLGTPTYSSGATYVTITEDVLGGDTTSAWFTNLTNPLNKGALAFAVGDFSTASGQSSFASGGAIASGDYSMAIGNGNISSGQSSVAMGQGSTASGNYSSIAMGTSVTASGQSAVAMGLGAGASGDYSIAMGINANTNAISGVSIGTQTFASGQSAVAMGNHTVAASFNSFALGRYNIGGGTAGSWVDTDPLFEIGNGTDNTHLSNAFTVLKNGNTRLGAMDSTITSQNILAIIGNANDYANLYIRNQNAGTLASADITWANDSTSQADYADIGLNSQANANPTYTGFGANDFYIYTAGAVKNLDLATGGNNDIKFFTNGYLTANLRMAVKGDGKINFGDYGQVALPGVNHDFTLYNQVSGSLITIQGNNKNITLKPASTGNIGFGVDTPTNYLSINGQAARTIWMERNTTSNTAGNSLKLQSGGATSGATDKDGGMMTVSPGVSTGTAKSSVRTQSLTRALSTGTSDNTLEDRVIVPSMNTLSTSVDKDLFTIAIPTGAMAGGHVYYTITATDGTAQQTHSGLMIWSAVNHLGTITSTVNEIGETTKTSTGTLTDTWTIVDSTGVATIRVNANSSLTTPVMTIRYWFDNGSSGAVTQL